MMPKPYLGIDPGIHGAFVLRRQDFSGGATLTQYWDMPTVKVGKRTRPDLPVIWDILSKIKGEFPKTFAVIEAVHPFPGEGVVSAWTLCEFSMAIRMALTGLKYEWQEVHPATWKKEMLMGVDKKDKQSSIFIARRIYPELELPSVTPTRGKNKGKTWEKEDRAEALLLSEFGRRRNL